MDLFEQAADVSEHAPLAEQMRPKNLTQFQGQSALLQANGHIVNRFRRGQPMGLILWGPPGSGKTSFAKSLGGEIQIPILEENAIDLGAKKIREIGERGRSALFERQQKTLVFIDEIHRLNRGQQDVLLPFLEKGFFYLVGATTENPSYQLNSALLSRCQLLVFEPHSPEALTAIFDQALMTKGLQRQSLLEDSTFEYLMDYSHGDARRLLNALEQVLFLFEDQPEGGRAPVADAKVREVIKTQGLRYDKKGDEHYDTISAFIKSIRGSDPNAGIYYLARMLQGGEDPVFIARRLMILASEDIGNGDPRALGIAVDGLKAVEAIGMPEAQICLAQVVVYLACAPKSNSSYVAINKARACVEKTGPLPVPKHLRSAKTKAMRQIGYGKGYGYAHNGDRGWVPQDFLPKGLDEPPFYEPSGRGFEKKMQEYLAWLRGSTESL